MKNSALTKTQFALPAELAGSFGRQPQPGFLNISDNHFSESNSDHNNAKSQDPISFLSSEHKNGLLLPEKSPSEVRSLENFESRSLLGKNSQSRIDAGGVNSDVSTGNSNKTAQHKLRDGDSTHYFTSYDTEVRNSSKIHGSDIKDTYDSRFETNPRRFSKNLEVQKSCGPNNFLPSHQLELDSIRHPSPDSRRNSRKSVISARDPYSQNEMGDDLISKVETDRFYIEKKRVSRNSSPTSEDQMKPSDFSQCRSHKSSMPTLQNTSDYDYPLNLCPSTTYQREMKENYFSTFRKESPTMKSSNVFSDRLQDDRGRNGKLETKFQDMDTLLQQMKVFQERLYQNYIEAKSEIQKETTEKSCLLNNIAQDTSQNEKLKHKLDKLLKVNQALMEENKYLTKSDQKKTEVIGKLEEQLKAAKSEVAILKEKHESKLNALNAKIKKYEENLDAVSAKERSKTSIVLEEN